MTLQLTFFNPLAIVLCIFLNMVVGALWYSPLLFGNIWLKLIQQNQQQARDITAQEARAAMSLSVIPASVLMICLALVLSLAGASTVIDGLALGTLIAIGIIGMSFTNLILFEERPVSLVIINVGYPFVVFNLAACILVLWQ